MKAFLRVFWFVALPIILSLGFRAILWHLITPVTVTLAHLPWLELAVKIVSVICSFLYIALLKLFGGKL